MPHPHSQAPHVHCTRLPWMGLSPPPPSLPGTWEGETNRQQSGLLGPGAGALSPPISDLAPAWGLCTLTSCPPSQLRCHLPNSAPPRSSRPPRMLTSPCPCPRPAPPSPPPVPPDITLLFLFSLQTWNCLAISDSVFTASPEAASWDCGTPILFLTVFLSSLPQLPHLGDRTMEATREVA